MLILIVIDVQYLQNVVLRFEEGSNGQNHSSSNTYHLIKNPLATFPILYLTLFEKLKGLTVYNFLNFEL